MSVDSTLSTVIGRPAHDATTMTIRKAAAPTMTAPRCLLRFTPLPQADHGRTAAPPGRSEPLCLIELDGDHVLAVAVERALLLREDADVLPVLHLRQHEAPVEFLRPDVRRPEHALTVDRGREVVDLPRLLEEPGAGETVVAVRLHHVVDDVTEEEPGRPGLRREPVGLALPADRLEERVHRLVLLGLLEGDEEQGGVVVVDVGPTLTEELGVVALERAVPDLHAGDTLDLRLLPHLYGALVVGDALAVRRVVLLDRLGDRRVIALRRLRRDLEEVFVLFDARLHVAGRDGSGRVHRGLQVAGEDPDPVQILVLLLVVEDLPDPGRVGLGMLVPRGAVQRARDDRERDRRALVGGLGLERRDVGKPRRLSGLVDALLERLDVVEEQRVRPDDREVLLARPDDGVAGLVGAELRVDEVDLDVPPGELAVAVDVLAEGLHPVHGALEQARPGRVVHVGDHRDPDGVRRDPDVAVRRPLVLLRSCRRRHQPRSDGQRHGHECPQAPLHRSPLATYGPPAPRGRPGAGHSGRNRNTFQDALGPPMVSRDGEPGGGAGPGGGDRPPRRRPLRRRPGPDLRLAAAPRAALPRRDHPALGRLPVPRHRRDREGPGDLLLVGGLPAEPPRRRLDDRQRRSAPQRTAAGRVPPLHAQGRRPPRGHRARRRARARRRRGRYGTVRGRRGAGGAAAGDGHRPAARVRRRAVAPGEALVRGDDRRRRRPPLHERRRGRGVRRLLRTRRPAHGGAAGHTGRRRDVAVDASRGRRRPHPRPDPLGGPAPRGRRRRDHPDRHHRRAARADRAPRATPAAPGRARAAPGRRRGVHPMGHAHPQHAPHGHAGHRGRRNARGRGRRAAAHVPLGEPRRSRVRRAAPLRRRARAQPAHRVRVRHPLLPRRRPRPPRDPGHVRGAAAAAARPAAGAGLAARTHPERLRARVPLAARRIHCYDVDAMATIAELVRSRAGDEHPAILFEDDSWSYADYASACAERATLLAELRRPGPFHVGVLLDNVPEFAMWLGAAAVAGAVVVGVNPTRRGAELARDITHTECQLLVTENRHAPLLDGLDTGVADDRVLVTESDAYLGLVEARRGAPLPDVEVAESDLYLLLFTSGTSGAPKACLCSQGRLAGIGVTLSTMVGLGADDVCYIAMPMFHSNALMAGWAPALAGGSA